MLKSIWRLLGECNEIASTSEDLIESIQHNRYRMLLVLIKEAVEKPVVILVVKRETERHQVGLTCTTPFC